MTKDIAPKTEVEEEVVEEGMEDSSETPGMENFHRTNVMSLLMHKLGSLETSEMVDFYDKVQGLIGKEASVVPGEFHGKNKASIRMHPSFALGAIKEAVKEDLATVFGTDTQLSEEFKDKMTTLFESAVGARVALIEASLVDAQEAAVEEEVSTITENLLEKMDDYLGYVCEEWVKENEVAIQSSLMSEITQDFIEDLRDVFTRHSISVPEGREDVCEMMAQKIEELEAELNETMHENMELSEVIQNSEKASIVADVSEGLTEIQTQKLIELAAGVDAESPDEFKEKLEVIREAHFVEAPPVTKRTRNSADTGLITEDIAYDPNAPEVPDKPAKRLEPEMQGIVNALKRTIRPTATT